MEDGTEEDGTEQVKTRVHWSFLISWLVNSYDQELWVKILVQW
jgi:hypothetical protein